MWEVLGLAKKAAQCGEVPVAAILYDSEMNEIARSSNFREKSKNPLDHAEMRVLLEASKKMANWRLNNCTLVVNLEPCIMCAGAIILSRIKKVVFAASCERFGAYGSRADLSLDKALNHKVELVPGVLAEEASSLMSAFFKEQRLSKLEKAKPSD